MDDNSRRWFLFMLLVLLIVQIYASRQTREAQKRKEAQERAQATLPASPGATPGRPAAPGSETLSSTSTLEAGATAADAEMAAPEPVEAEPGREIVLETDTYRITFTTAGAHPTRWQIIDPRFAKAAHNDVEAAWARGSRGLKVGDFLPIDLIPAYEGLGAGRQYPLTVVLKETGGRYYDSFNLRNYEADPVRSEADGAKVLVMRSPVSREGLRLTKTFRFPQRGFLSSLKIEVQNVAREGGQNLEFREPLQPGLGVLWGPGIGSAVPNAADLRVCRVASYDGERILSDQMRGWEKVARDLTNERTYQSVRWLMLDSRFYVAAIAPAGTANAPFGRAVVKPQDVPSDPNLLGKIAPPYTVEIYSDGFLLRPGQSRVMEYNVFVGPKDRDILSEVDKEYKAQNLNLRGILFYPLIHMQPFHWISKDLMRPLSLFMLMLLGLFHSWTGSYGVAIVLLVLVMRLIIQPLTHIGMKSQARVMAEQKRIKPLIDAINEKYKDDPQKRNAEIWKTYREHGVNPLGMMKGCFWMLFQLPIFYAMYALIVGAIDLRGAGFLWIKDLTAEDALFSWGISLPFLGHYFNLIPILMGLSQVFAQRLQSADIQDPTQKQMATLMPIMMTVFLYRFASALNLYWFVSNIWQIVFQVFVNKRVKEEAEKRAVKAFEERQAAIQAGTHKKAPPKPGWRDKMMKYLEEKAKDTEKARGKK